MRSLNISKRTPFSYGLTVCSIVAAILLAGCKSGDADGEADAAAARSDQQTAAGVEQTASSASHNAGEVADAGRNVQTLQHLLSTDDPAFLSRLDLISGHLLVSRRLLEQGHVAAATLHLEHPTDELYSQVEGAISSRDLPGFAAELQSVSAAIEAATDVEQAYRDLQQAIANHSKAISNSHDDTVLLQRITRLLRSAADAYASGVVAGEVSNLHEYQTAWGHTEFAGQLLDSVSDSAVREQAAALLDDLRPLWPGLLPPQQVSGDAAQLYGAAARMEYLASGMND